MQTSNGTIHAIVYAVRGCKLTFLVGRSYDLNGSECYFNRKAYKLIARHSGKAMDVDGAYTADGATIQQWTDTGGNNQQWYLIKQWQNSKNRESKVTTMRDTACGLGMCLFCI
ncbi:RICIN domain-containing protein [Paenibacillus tarimensis]